MSTEKLYGHSVKVIRSDNGTEFVNKHVKTFLDEKGIMQETSAPYTPEQNGVAERENRTVVEMARTMLCSMNLPKMLWAEAVAYATLILNNTACDSDGKTPYERWTSNRSDLEMFKTFGCTAYYHIPKQLRYKLDPRSKKAVFVGIENTSKKIRLFDPSLNKIIISSSVIFNEIETTSLTAKQLTTASFEDLKDDSDRDDGDENQIIARDGPNLRPRSNLKRPDFYQANTAEIEEPQTYEEAVNGKDKNKWEAAMQEELDSLNENEVYVECELPNGKKAIGSKWVFKLKRIPGEKDRFKARCVARGYSQRHGIDYGETFSPVIRYESIRILLALAAIKNLYMKQCDVKTAFLYGNLDEEIYLEPPPGFNSGKFWTLKKSLYGLKQAPRCWNSTFHDFLMKYNLKQNTADQCVYHSKVNEFDLFFGLYVDDGIILSRSECIIDEFLNEMKERFKIKISSPNYFVGMEIEQDAISKDIRIHQSTYIENILNKYKLQEIAELSIPSDPNVQLTRHEGENINVPYRQVVGSLMFLACVTRPDIAFAVNQVSRYLEIWKRALECGSKDFEVPKAD